MTTVVNKYKDQYDEYCGRGTIFGNPYIIGRDGTREEVIKRYRGEWFPFLLRDRRFVNELKKLKNKRIACFCAPDKCHLDCVAEWVNKNC